MKKLTALNVDDIQIMKNLCRKTSTASSPYLANEYFIMKQQYETYIQNSGLPNNCPAVNINRDLALKLKYHYEKESPKLALSYINEIRKELSPRTCPMCGSSGTSTVDHYLPKANYPEWTIFSRNLVPACDCNVRRGTRVCGANANERVFHPYYDTALQNRLMSCNFSGNLQAPKIEIVGLRAPNVHPDMTEFHLNEIVRKSNIVNWLGDIWEGLRVYPSDIIANMEPDMLISRNELINKVTSLLQKYDRQHKTPNNWFSVFMHGVLQDQTVIDWIVAQQNGIVNGAIQTG